MPRNKKVEETKNRRSKKKDDEEENEDIDELLEATSKDERKDKDKSKSKKSRGKKKESDLLDEEEATVSDLELDDEDEEKPSSRDDRDDQDDRDIVSSSRPPRYPKIDPNMRLKDLNIMQILSYLIQYGADNYNPKLKNGARILSAQLKDRGRHGGSKRNDSGDSGGRRFTPNPRNNQYDRGNSGGMGGGMGGKPNRGGGMGFDGNRRSSRTQSNFNPRSTNRSQDLYDDIE